MNDFAAYLISAWQEMGLTLRDLPKAGKARIRVARETPWHLAMAVSVAALAVTSLQPQLAGAQEIIRLRAAPKAHLNHISADEVRPGYWKFLMSEMNSWRTVDDTDLPDFDSLIK